MKLFFSLYFLMNVSFAQVAIINTQKDSTVLNQVKEIIHNKLFIPESIVEEFKKEKLQGITNV